MAGGGRHLRTAAGLLDPYPGAGGGAARGHGAQLGPALEGLVDQGFQRLGVGCRELQRLGGHDLGAGVEGQQPRQVGGGDAGLAGGTVVLVEPLQVALVIGAGYGRAAAGDGVPEVQLLADGTDATSAGIGLSYAADILGRESVRLAAARGGPGLGRVELVPRVWYNPDLKSRWFYVPAILALLLMVMTLVLSSMGVVREKEIGTLEQVMVSPVRPWQLIVGKLFPYAVIGFVDIFLVAGIAVLWFQVPLRGSFLLLLGLTMLLVLGNLGLGLLVSTIARNQQQAMMGAAFVLMLPQIYLSGLIFPIENMPPAIAAATYVSRYATTPPSCGGSSSRAPASRCCGPRPWRSPASRSPSWPWRRCASRSVSNSPRVRASPAAART